MNPDETIEAMKRQLDIIDRQILDLESVKMAIRGYISVEQIRKLIDEYAIKQKEENQNGKI